MRARSLQMSSPDLPSLKWQRRLTLVGLLLAIPCALVLGWVWAGSAPLTTPFSPPRRVAARGEFSLGPAQIELPTRTVVQKPKLPPRLDPVGDYRPLVTDLSPAAAESRLAELAQSLSSDAMQGRGVQTEGIEVAAELIGQSFQEAGLRTDLIGGGPYQEFLLNSRLGLGGTNQMELTHQNEILFSLIVGRDFTPLSLSGSGDFNLPLAFAGYGITAPEYEYDDYAGLDVNGKAVIVLRREPQDHSPTSRFDGEKSSHHSYFATKVTNAAAHGAAAIVLVTDHSELQERRKDLGPDASSDDLDPLLRFEIGSSVAERRIPVIHVRRSVIEPLIHKAVACELATIEEQIDTRLRPNSFELPDYRLRGAVTLVPTGQSLKNVLGLLPGYGPDAGEAIVLGAHYDHLGYGSQASSAARDGRSLHNGADDNASGTAVMVEVARQLASRSEPLNRSVLFIAFTAEELGLVGSRRYLQDPVIPVSNTITMINLDMVGRLRHDQLLVYGTGTAAGFESLIATHAAPFGLKPQTSPSGFGPSDHAAFHERGLPVLYFFTGFHPEYHRPEDDFETLNLAGMQRIAGFTAAVIADLANRPERVHLQAAESLIADSHGARVVVPQELSVTPPQRTVTLGLLLDRTCLEPGYGVGRVLGGSPAEQAGLQPGDVVVQYNDHILQKPADLSKALSTAKPGDQPRLKVRRGTQERDVTVTLGQP